MPDNKKEIAVVYHADCPDGFGGAYAAWKKFGGRALYFPVQHNTEPPSEFSSMDVYFIDFVYGREVMEKLKNSVRKISIIDHHISAEPLLKLADDFLFDINHSGAVLAWKYFHPEKNIPKLLSHIEDIDLWRFKLDKASEVSEFIGLYDYDFDAWEGLANMLETPSGHEQAVSSGSLLIKKTEKQVKKLVENAESVSFEGYDCLMVNTAFHQSRVGNELVKIKPPLAIIWFRKEKKIIVSLRSDGTVDVSALAGKYGGGGHKSAAGFSWEEETLFDFEIIKKIV